jgi:hypothetical protein
MNTSSQESYVLPRWMHAWERFWFAPADPTVLALIRICAGVIVTYSMFAYSFRLQEFLGKDAWDDMELRGGELRDYPIATASLDWTRAGSLPDPKNKFEEDYLSAYRKDFGEKPPPPYPANAEEAKALNDFRLEFGMDLRVNGARPWATEAQKAYAREYTRWLGVPPPGYPKSDEEMNEITDYIMKWHVDPRYVYAKGQRIFSLWFHVTDPAAMAVIHSIFVACAFLFTVGLGTRLTTAVTWFGALCYIQRNNVVLFGVDTMMTIVLFYLMFSPCGAVYSLDRLVRQWWVKAKPDVVAWWYRLLRMPLPSEIQPADPVPDEPAPSVAANVAIRLLQVHLCTIYLVSGLSKLLGRTWWEGNAIWIAMTNYEFSPMQSELYLGLLRFLGSHQLLFDAFMSGGGMFTLLFEVGYAFLIWRPRLRFFYLGSAILLHGGIGLFMGLRTFALIMLVMNMAFLRKEEVLWLFALPGKLWKAKPAAQAPAPQPETAAVK